MIERNRRKVKPLLPQLLPESSIGGSCSWPAMEALGFAERTLPSKVLVNFVNSDFSMVASLLAKRLGFQATSVRWSSQRDI